MPSVNRAGSTEALARKGIPGVGRLLTQQEAADLLGISLRSVIRMVRAGDLTSVRMNERHVRIPMSSVERWVKGQIKKGVA